MNQIGLGVGEFHLDLVRAAQVFHWAWNIVPTKEPVGVGIHHVGQCNGANYAIRQRSTHITSSQREFGPGFDHLLKLYIPSAVTNSGSTHDINGPATQLHLKFAHPLHIRQITASLVLRGEGHLRREKGTNKSEEQSFHGDSLTNFSEPSKTTVPQDNPGTLYRFP